MLNKECNIAEMRKCGLSENTSSTYISILARAYDVQKFFKFQILMWNTTRSNQSTKQDIYAIVKVNYIYKIYIETRNKKYCVQSVFNSY